MKLTFKIRVCVYVLVTFEGVLTFKNLYKIGPCNNFVSGENELTGHGEK